jgi:GNAT superfamily N-acetyltransferase
MEIARATVAEIMEAPEFPALIEGYDNECAIEGLPSPAAKLESYRILEMTGALDVFAARHSGELVGFITVLASPSLHFSVPLAVTESFYVAPGHRGFTGLGLLAAAEKQAKTCGSPILQVCAPLASRLCELLPKCGYIPTNVVFTKRLDDVH